MTMMMRMHELATARGDGLRPELLALLRRRAAIENDPAIRELATVEGGQCAGPPPTGAVDGAPPSGVLRFPDRLSISNQQRRSRKGNRCT